MNKKQIFALFFIAFLIRIIYLVVTDDNSLNSDGLEYYIIGKAILEQGILLLDPIVNNYFAPFHPIVAPFFPMVIAASIYAFGDTVLPILIINCAVSAVSVVLIYEIGIKVFTKKIALFCLVWSLVNFNFLRLNTYVMKESFVIFFLLLLVFILIKHQESKTNYIHTALLAIVYALLIHTDERYLVYLPVILVFVLLTNNIELKKRLMNSTLFLIATIIFLVPTTYRNYKVYDQIAILSERTSVITAPIFGGKVLTSYNDDLSLTSVLDTIINKKVPVGMSPDMYLEYKEVIESGNIPYQFSISERIIKGCINFFKPAYFSASFINRGYSLQKWSLRHNIIGMVFFGIFLPFYFVGLFFAFRNKNVLILRVIALIPLVQMLLHATLGHTLERYRIPIDSFVVMIACFGFFSLYTIIRPKYLHYFKID